MKNTNHVLSSQKKFQLEYDKNNRKNYALAHQESIWNN